MLNFLKPTYLVESIYDLSASELQDHGITTVLTDLDNTLLAWHNPDGTPELHEWLKQLHAAKIEVVVVSNNTWKRVGQAVAGLPVDYVAWSLKPLPRGIHQVLRKQKLNPAEVIMVGDQMLTDVWAAHSAGVRSVLVKPLVESDLWQTWLNRAIEKQVKKHFYGSATDLPWQKELVAADHSE
ncbi:YqeG family HAD IIIA-type phosphatase [Leuconostocaceae bacterium ESL0958]|nr:YqeG family HAD IIIA-type phosphatase [Leuconostocaceae bacterium ESL0958]